MSHKAQRLLVAALTLSLTALLAISGVQLFTDSELTLSSEEQQIAMIPGDICNNVFKACGGILTCPGGCWCWDMGTGSGLCLEN